MMVDVKVRIGIGTGRGALGPQQLGDVLDAIEAHHFDSIWLSEILTGGGFDPLAGLAFAAARSPVKLGTTMLLPGRNAVRLAKALATVDVLSGGRLLVTFVPGVLRSPEREAIGVPPRDRGKAMEEALPLLRRLLAGEETDYEGPLGAFSDIRLQPLPVQQPLEFWLGGMVERSLERCGRFGDGWLPSACTPAEAAAGRVAVERAASAAGRAISDEHYGVSIAYLRGDPTPEQSRQIEERAKGRDPDLVVPGDLHALRALLESFIAEGFSKFVLRPLGDLTDADGELAALADAVGDLQS